MIVEGEMRFDYTLRPGIVRTSNALRLLAMAGIDVPEHERQALEGSPLHTTETPSAQAIRDTRIAPAITAVTTSVFPKETR